MQVIFSTIITPMSETASKRASKTMNKASVMRRAVDIVEKRDAKPVPHDKIKGIMEDSGQPFPVVKKFVNEVLDMTEQEFCDTVSRKLKVMVEDSLDILHTKLDQIPPQHLAYCVDTLIKNSLVLAGRPSSITASASVKLGDSEMTPEEVREILKGTKKAVKKAEIKPAEVINNGKDNDEPEK